MLHTAGVHLLAREGSNAAAAAKLKALLQALERQEPRNPALWLRLAQPYARLAGILLNLQALIRYLLYADWILWSLVCRKV